MAAMTFDDVMAQLEQNGSEQTRKTYSRHGIRMPMFGVSYAVLGKLKKQIKRDQALAEALWATGNHDARILALMIADPARTTPALLNTWIRDLSNYGIADVFGSFAATVPGVQPLANQWIDADHEWIEAAGWNVLAVLCGQPDAITDADCLAYLARIEREIAGAKNRVRYSMNQVVINIGVRGGDMERAACETAARIGVVHVDHGLTGCKTPDAISYIRKTLDHRAKKAKA